MTPHPPPQYRHKKAECLFVFIIGLLSARPDGGSEKGTGKERHEGMIEAGPDGCGLPICFTVFITALQSLNTAV